MDALDWLGIALLISGAIISLSGVGLILGVPMMGIGVVIVILNQFTNAIIELSSLAGDSSSSAQSTSRREVMYSGRDHDTIAAGSYIYYEFNVEQSAILEYTVDSLGRQNVNTILTVAEELDRFEYKENIRIIQKGSEFGTEHAHVQTRIGPANYVLIVDNTGRTGENVGTASADIEIEYEIRE